jgi:hypothetical protein
MKKNHNEIPGSPIEPSDKTEQIKRDFARIAARHGLISNVTVEIPKQVLDIVIGDE